MRVSIRPKESQTLGHANGVAILGIELNRDDNRAISDAGLGGILAIGVGRALSNTIFGFGVGIAGEAISQTLPSLIFIVSGARADLDASSG